MLIKKIFNNNVILTEENGQEIVAMGRGLAFQKKVGMEVPKECVDKVYALKDHELLEKFKQLLSGVSEEYLDASMEIIELAEQKFGSLNESIYLTLTDHIHTAVERLRKQCSVHNMMVWEIQSFYPEEFKLAQQAVEILSKRFELEFPEDEAGFIAMHFIDAQMDSQQSLANKILAFIQEMTNIVRRTCRVEFDKDSVSYYRFVTHLKFFARRVFEQQPSKAEIDEVIELMIKAKYAQAYECAERISAFVEQKYGYQVSRDERFYLTIHISKALRAKSQENLS